MKAVIFDYFWTLYNPDTDGLMPGSFEVLQQLNQQGIKLFIISQSGEEGKKELQHLGIGQFFDHMMMQNSKSREDFEACLKICDRKTKWYVIGDRVKKEIRYGNECGMTTIWIQQGGFSHDLPNEPVEEPDHTVTNLLEAAEIILKKNKATEL